MRRKLNLARSAGCKPTTPLVETLATAVPPPPVEIIYSKEVKGYIENSEFQVKTFSSKLAAILDESQREELELLEDIKAIKQMTKSIKKIRKQISLTNDSISFINKNVTDSLMPG
jgi:hypothetical protein